MELGALEVAVEDRGADDGGEVEEDELHGDDDFGVEAHEGAVEVADLADAGDDEDLGWVRGWSMVPAYHG